MNTLISWCVDCGRDAELDAVPQAMPTEYVCRECAAAYVVEPEPDGRYASAHVAA
jgi:DNA-directed RNA polymerase subunit RPC12/RpoP